MIRSTCSQFGEFLVRSTTMKATRLRIIGTIAIGIALITPLIGASPIAAAQEDQLSAQMIQDRDYPSRSNVVAGRQILSNAPPVAPGYRQFMGFIFAVLSGEAEIVPLMPPVPEDVSAHTSLTYVTVGDNELKLDIYSPKNTVKPAPLVVLVHGGCWMDGTREEMGFYAVNLARRGYVTASVDYRLSEEAPYPAAIDDLRSALQWLTTNASTYDIDPSRIALMGASAGGHLVEYLGYAANTSTKEYPNGLGPKVQAIIPLYGWSDLTDASVNYQYYMELFLGSKYADAPKLYEEASPITHVDKHDPPTLLLHGTIDTIVPITQADKLAKKLEQNDVPYIYAPFKGGYHGYDMFQDSNPSVMYLIEEFLAEYLAK
jgi:acetyl esterase/lipase